MNPVQIGDATLYWGDCLEILPMLSGLRDGCQNVDVSAEQGGGAGIALPTRIDTVITDPPYGVGINYASYNDDLPATISMVIAFVKAATAMARVVAFTAGKWDTELALYQQFPPRWRICWFKGAQSTASPIGFNDWEAVLVYGDKIHNNAHDYFLAQPEKMGAYGHPCPKPVRYSEILIGRLAKPVGVICDPFMGSGTTGVACANLGRKFIGIEIERKYFDIACERIDNAYRQQRMFA